VILSDRLDPTGRFRRSRRWDAGCCELFPFVGAERKRAFAELGAVAVLAKPFSFATLHAALDHALAWRLPAN
jgi:CheY-like chemotaxis protein